MSLIRLTYCQPYVAGLTVGSKHFEAYARIARSVPLFVWSRPQGLARLAGLAWLETSLESTVDRLGLRRLPGRIEEIQEIADNWLGCLRACGKMCHKKSYLGQETIQAEN